MDDTAILEAIAASLVPAPGMEPVAYQRQMAGQVLAGLTEAGYRVERPLDETEVDDLIEALYEAIEDTRGWLDAGQADDEAHEAAARAKIARYGALITRLNV